MPRTPLMHTIGLSSVIGMICCGVGKSGSGYTTETYKHQLSITLLPDENQSSIEVRCSLHPVRPSAIVVDIEVVAKSPVLVRGQHAMSYVAPIDADRIAIIHGLAKTPMAYEMHDGLYDPRQYEIIQAGQSWRVRNTITLDSSVIEPHYIFGLSASEVRPLCCSVTYWDLPDNAENLDMYAAMHTALAGKRHYANTNTVLVSGSTIK